MSVCERTNVRWITHSEQINHVFVQTLWLRSFILHTFIFIRCDGSSAFTLPAQLTYSLFSLLFLFHIYHLVAVSWRTNEHTIVLDYISDVSMATCVRRYRRWLPNKYAVRGGRLTAPIVLHLFDCCLSSFNRIRAHTHAHNRHWFEMKMLYVFIPSRSNHAHTPASTRISIESLTLVLT